MACPVARSKVVPHRKPPTRGGRRFASRVQSHRHSKHAMPNSFLFRNRGQALGTEPCVPEKSRMAAEEHRAKASSTERAAHQPARSNVLRTTPKCSGAPANRNRMEMVSVGVSAERGGAEGLRLTIPAGVSSYISINICVCTHKKEYTYIYTHKYKR